MTRRILSLLALAVIVGLATPFLSWAAFLAIPAVIGSKHVLNARRVPQVAARLPQVAEQGSISRA